MNLGEIDEFLEGQKKKLLNLRQQQQQKTPE